MKFVFLLEVLNLESHVNVPTHRNGHTLDIVLSRKNSRLIHNKPKVVLPCIGASDGLSLLDHYIIHMHHLGS